MQETRRELVDRLLRFVGELNDPDARNVAQDLVGEALLVIWIAHAFRDFELPDPVVVNLVAGTRTYILPGYFGRIASKDGRVRNLTTGGWLESTTGAMLYRDNPAAGTTVDTRRNDPTRYFIAGKTGVSVQPAAGGEALELVSSDAGDLDVVVSLEGLDAAGEWTSAQIELTGTAPVAAGTWTLVNTFAKAFPAGTDPQTAYTSSRGTVTLRVTGAGATRQQLLSQESAREHFQITFDPTPARAAAIALPVLRAPRRLWHDADVLPALWGPALFEEALIQYRVNTGEISNGASIARPRRDDLIAYDNENRSGGRTYRTRGFGE